MSKVIPQPVASAVSQLPAMLQGHALALLEDVDWSTLPEVKENNMLWASLPGVWACSEFVARSCLRHPKLLQELITSGALRQGLDTPAFKTEVWTALSKAADEAQAKKCLRQIRMREWVRIAWRDLAGWADLDEVLETVTSLADELVGAALQWCWAHTEQDIGQGLAGAGPFVVLGMGKLGGRELNFSSDIDLIFFYLQDDPIQGQDTHGNHEFFVKLSRQLIKLLGDTTEDGFVFRVDMRLRPNGSTGPMALSFDAAEHYYQIHGREWERYAMIKARVIAGDPDSGNELLQRLHPFVYRKYLDYGAIGAIRKLKRSINQELTRKGIADNIKLGPGGIREIEFIGQVFQLVRGGREPALQSRSIRPTLKQLSSLGQMTATAVTELSAAYDFLRRTEHRLQMVADRQTHVLPKDELGQARLAYSMGYSSWREYEPALRRHMQKVHGHFSQVFTAPQGEQDTDRDNPLLAVWLQELEPEHAMAALARAGYKKDPAQVYLLLKGLHSGSAYNSFAVEGRQRADTLAPLLIAAAGLTATPELTLSRLARVVESIGRRSSYLALMIENPMVLSQLVKLCAASPWIADWIAQHPLLLDELLNPVDAYSPPSREQLSQELASCLLPVEAGDLEREMEILREFCNRHVLHVAAADIGPGLAATAVARQITEIAEVILEASLGLAMQAMEARYGCPHCESEQGAYRPGFAVIAYGKLGSHELGYGSDVDMIFLYQGCGASAVTTGERAVANETFFLRTGQRLIHILTTRMHGGILYETDMRLRPSGQSGPLVTQLQAFREYQTGRAWTWEHQALVRARAVAGDAAVARAFTEVRRDVLCRQRDATVLAAEVAGMREKMRGTREPHDPDLFDIKHDRGGIVDIEFMVQYWVLRWAHDTPRLTEHTDNVAILTALEAEGLLPAEQIRVLAGAYERYLSTAYRLKLMEAGSLIGLEAVDGLPQQIARYWNEIFPSSDKPGAGS
ncbi:MAG: bifunctional [glutamate--ammonia ligase]-adenylyl-L-tyrosine phosphorylase/[glutamate--ammonia-ligase] adenylyltransferase [Gammaproteobacteria bacterium]|nr:MAG: bifunctional [glutamate--ammonia ligase]-adenylyl-L-tyrosine phosphorylase/[glutamate--ammonia-ligase] adenylyltransferase [Gammaproteobacteria bacterium]